MPDDVFYDELYKAMGGKSDGYFDVLGVHAAGFKAAPEVSPEEAAADKAKYGGERFFTFRRVEDIRMLVQARLHLLGGHVLAAGDDHVLLPIGDPQEPVLELSAVPRTEPLAGERLP